MINRSQLLASIASSAATFGGAPTPFGCVPENAPITRPADASAFRWLVSVVGHHVGVLADVGVLAIARNHESPSVLINIPRARPGALTWESTPPPDTPYYTQSRPVSDTFTYGGPDELSTGAAIGAYAIFAFYVPLSPQLFLMRIAPPTREMQTLSLPDDSHGQPVALYEEGSHVVVVRQDGTLSRLDY